ncbi:hypothetical protein MKX01_009194 [Papaver californicum]|nr:hypothetical protein MKX01_009194 [Papaver californicum]
MCGFVYYLEAVILIAQLPKPWRDTAIGILGVLVNPFMYKAPCNVLVRVCETESLEYMSFLDSLCGFLNAGCWLTYGWLRDDPYIITTSIPNCVMGIVELSVYAYYYYNYPQSKSIETKKNRQNQLRKAVESPDKV